MRHGDQLGPYEILGPLGADGTGEVYRAHDPNLKIDVAIKVLPAELAADPDRLGTWLYVGAALMWPVNNQR